MVSPRDRLIVALDVPTRGAAEAIVESLGDTVNFYKIGYQLLFADGLALTQDLTRMGKRVFLDMKLHDIANTVAKGVENIARSGATFLTVHAYPQTMRAAVAARADSQLRLIAVTVLTSYDDRDLGEAGYALGVEDLVAERAGQARQIGLDGLVCAAEEVVALRRIVGPDLILVTPGIRPLGARANDQKRVMTPARAIAAGADYLIIGRPVVEAENPQLAAAAIVEEIDRATPTDRVQQ